MNLWHVPVEEPELQPPGHGAAGSSTPTAVLVPASAAAHLPSSVMAEQRPLASRQGESNWQQMTPYHLCVPFECGMVWMGKWEGEREGRRAV